MVKLLEHLKHTVTALAVTALFVPATTYAQAASDAKLDESLRESLERGCTGAQPVIVRTKPGYRQGLRDSLSAHGDVVKGEFPALDAVAADVHCEDLAALAGFDSTESVSLNGPVAVQSVLTDAQAALNAAKASLLDAKADANDAQKALRTAERALALADAQVGREEGARPRAAVECRRQTGGGGRRGGEAGRSRRRGCSCGSRLQRGAHGGNRGAGCGDGRVE